MTMQEKTFASWSATRAISAIRDHLRGDLTLSSFSDQARSARVFNTLA